VFVSIGDADKLKVFLEKNPQVDPTMALVDDYDFGAYSAAGFGRFDEQDQEVAKEAMQNMNAPNLGWKGAWDYATSVMKVSPIPDDMKFGQIPEGVLRLGGTFVISGDDIVYRWSDRVPGDHPDIDNVVSIAREAAAAPKKKAGFQLPSLFNL
jgi:hypothetical protein